MFTTDSFITNNIAKPLDSLGETLSRISIRDINSLKKRIEFYMVHYKTISRVSKNAQFDDRKFNFLESLNKMLELEIQKRF